MKEFTIAERIGDWKGHSVAMEKMLHLFAPTGHINYVKSARLYLQRVAELETEYETRNLKLENWLYQQFTNKGFYCVR